MLLCYGSGWFEGFQWECLGFIYVVYNYDFFQVRILEGIKYFLVIIFFKGNLSVCFYCCGCV